MAGTGQCIRRGDALALAAHALPWLFIAAAPVVFAAATWSDLPESNVGSAAVRLFGLPIVMMELCTIVSALLLGWRPLEQLRSLSIASRGLLVGLLALAFGTAILAAPRPQSAILWTDISLLHLLFGFAIAHLVQDSTGWERRLIWPAVVAGLSIFAIMLMLFVNVRHPISFDWRYMGFGVSNVRQLGFYSAVGTAAALGLAIRRRGVKQALFMLAGGLSLSIALWSGTRGAPVALASALLLLLVFFPAVRTIRTLFATLSISVIAVVIAMQQAPPDPHYGFWRLGASVGAPSLNDLSSNRIAIWHDAWDSFLSRPLFGFGEAQFGFVRPEIGVAYLHPHNILLQLLFQWGIVGSAIVAALSVIFIRACRGLAAGTAEMVIPAAFVALVIAIYSLFDGALFHTYPTMMFAFSISILVSGKADEPAVNR